MASNDFTERRIPAGSTYPGSSYGSLYPMYVPPPPKNWEAGYADGFRDGFLAGRTSATQEMKPGNYTINVTQPATEPTREQVDTLTARSTRV